MAETGTLVKRHYDVDAKGRRVVEQVVTFSGAGTFTQTKAALGLEHLAEVAIVAQASGGAAIDLTTNSTTQVILTAGGAATAVTLRFAGK